MEAVKIDQFRNLASGQPSLITTGKQRLIVQFGKPESGTGTASIIYVRDMTGKDVIPPIDMRQLGYTQNIFGVAGFRSDFDGRLKLVVVLHPNGVTSGNARVRVLVTTDLVLEAGTP